MRHFLCKKYRNKQTWLTALRRVEWSLLVRVSTLRWRSHGPEKLSWAVARSQTSLVQKFSLATSEYLCGSRMDLISDYAWAGDAASRQMHSAQERKKVRLVNVVMTVIVVTLIELILALDFTPGIAVLRSGLRALGRGFRWHSHWRDAKVDDHFEKPFWTLLLLLLRQWLTLLKQSFRRSTDSGFFRPNVLPIKWLSQTQDGFGLFKLRLVNLNTELIKFTWNFAGTLSDPQKRI